METFKLYIHAGYSDVHIKLHTIQKAKEGKVKMVGGQSCPIKSTIINFKSVETHHDLF